MTTIYLSAVNGLADARLVTAAPGWRQDPMAVLLAFPYLGKQTDLIIAELGASALMLDSGAYSAKTLGIQIDIQDLIAEARKPRWNQVVALDVIGDWRASARNAEVMSADLGAERVIPVYHIGEPWDVLRYYSSRWPTVGLGGLVGQKPEVIRRFIVQCHARVWPQRFHVFGVTAENVLMATPLWSCDASTWIMVVGAKKCGVSSNRPAQMPGLNRKHGVAQWIQEMQRRQRLARARWAAALEELA